MGNEAYLYFSDYKIKTDTSIWPFSSNVNDEGFLVSGLPSQYPYYIYNNQTKYFSFYFAKGDVSTSYNREVQKISSVFSFMGGLIGAIVASLFMINSFTDYSYEVSIALEIFKKKKGDEK